MNAYLFLADAANQGAGVFLGLGMFGLLLALAVGIFWIWMLVDALTNTRLQPPMRLVWTLLIFFLPLVGGLVYLFAGRTGKVSA